MTFAAIDCRCEFQCSLPQYETERILEGYVASLGGAVERGVMATKVEPDASRVLVELVHGGGVVETVHPGVVIGSFNKSSSLSLRRRSLTSCSA